MINKYPQVWREDQNKLNQCQNKGRIKTQTFPHIPLPQKIISDSDIWFFRTVRLICIIHGTRREIFNLKDTTALRLSAIRLDTEIILYKTTV